MTRVILRNAEGMKLNGRPPSNISGFSDDEDAVHSGSATGISDVDPAEYSSQSKSQKNIGHPFDPVNNILDKIDAELVSLTRSQSSTATDSTVVHRPHSQPSSADHSRLESGDGLSISQLGSIHPRSFSPPAMMRTGSSDRDTGFGSYDSLQHRRAPSPEMVYKDGRHVYQNGHHGRRRDDDKSSRGPDAGTAVAMDSKQVDDKFKEIMQEKRKGGYKSSGNEDAETIRTEDFVEKFQDTLVYSSADEQERLKNLDEDVSDGGWDTDTIQRKLAILTNTSLPEDRSFARPLRSLEQQRRKLIPLVETRAFKGTQGTPPIYPKPTPTSSLPRPSRGGVRMSSGFASDADSVKTEDFESHFNNMMVNQGETSDPDTATNDPIHARVKQLLKATAKYEDTSYNQYSYPLTTSILKQSYSQDKPHRGPEPFRSKQHVRIDSSPRQFEEHDKGEDSDDTLCSDKEETRKWQPPTWDASKLPAPFSIDSDPWEEHEKYRIKHGPLSNVSSGDDSFSKSSSLSSFSGSSSEKEKAQQRLARGDYPVAYIGHPSSGLTNFSRQLSTASSAVSSSTSASDYPSSDYLETANASRSTSTSESMLEDSDAKMLYEMQMRYRERDSNVGRGISNYYASGIQNSNTSDMGYSFNHSNSKPLDKKGERNIHEKRDIIVPDEEEEIPFAKYTFNKKPDKIKPTSKGNYPYDKPFMKDSVDSKRLMDQYMYLHGPPGKRLTNSSSSSSLFSSITSNSFTDTYSSPEDLNLNDSYDFDSQRGRHGSFSGPGIVAPKLNHMLNNIQNGAKMVPGPYPPYLGVDFPPAPSPVPMDTSSTSAEQVLASLGFGETQNFLPERFLRSWVNKMVQSQQREREILHQQMIMLQQQQQQHQQQQQQYYHYPDSSYDDNDLPPSVSAQHSGHSTPKWRHSLENLHSGHPPTARQKIGHRRLFRRAHSFNPMLKETSNKFNQSMDSNGTEFESEKDFGSIGALPVKKENSFDKLKRILQNSDLDYPQEVKRNHFSSNRQNSLPLFLETLSEEDEVKSRSRSPSFEKLWDNNNISLSHMKNFFQEEERKSSAENSRKSSLAEPKISEVISGIKEALQKSEDRESWSSSASSHSNMGKKSPTVPEKVNHILQLPSIIVSEREDSDHGSPKNIEIETTLRPASPRLVSPRPVSPRPLSPNPDNQKKTKKQEDAPSKDSLEIAEILGSSTERRSSLKAFVPTLTTISSPGISSKGHGRRKSLNEAEQSNSNFLRIVSDFDDKCLSPSSTASPLELSPITVIELTKLDNQNDSLETEDSVPKVIDSEGSVSKGSNRKINLRNKMGGTPISRKQHSGSLRRHSAGLDKTPKVLALERRSYERDTETQEEKEVFEEEEAKACNENVEKEIQTMDDSLPPIVNFCDIPSVLEMLLKKLPEHGANLFYLAQDRGTQYEEQPETLPDKAPTTKVDYSESTIREDSDKLDSGFTSNQGSNESMLSPMQASSRLSSSSNPESDNRESQKISSNLNEFSIEKKKLGNGANTEAKQYDLQLHEVDKTTNSAKENCEIKMYRSEAFLMIGKPVINNKSKLERMANAPKQRTCDYDSKIVNEPLLTERCDILPEFDQRNTLESQNQSSKHSKFRTASPQKGNDTHSNGNKKIVHFAMTDSQEENENKKSVNLKRLEKNRTKFHDLKAFSFDRRKHKSKTNFGEKIISNSYDTYLSGASDSSDGQPLNYSFLRDGKPDLMDHFGVIDNSVSETESDIEMSYESDMSENESTSTSMLVNIPHENHTSRSTGDTNTETENSSMSDVDLEHEMNRFGYFGLVKGVNNSNPDLGQLQKSLSLSDEHHERMASSGFHQVEKFGKHYAWRSLDFDTLNTRRAILQKIGGNAFSKSFDTGSSSVSGSASSLENIIPEESVLTTRCEDFIKEFREKGDVLSTSIRDEEKQIFGSLAVDFSDIDKIKDAPNTQTLVPENFEKHESVDDSLSECNKPENMKSEFLDIDLSEIDKYCNMSDIQVLENIDEETDELEKFIDSYVEISHENMELPETEYDETKAVIPEEIKSVEKHRDSEDGQLKSLDCYFETGAEIIASDGNEVMSHKFKFEETNNFELVEKDDVFDDIDMNKILDEYVIVERSSATEPGVKILDISVDELLKNDYENCTDLPPETDDNLENIEVSDEITKLKEDFEKHTYKNVKIKTFQLGKNSINMRTFGNFSTRDKGKFENIVPVNVQISVTDTDALTNEITDEITNGINSMLSEETVQIEDDRENLEQYSEGRKTYENMPVVAEEMLQIGDNIENIEKDSERTNVASFVMCESDKTETESEKMKKIKELYKSFSYDDFDALLNELDSQADDNVQKLSERFDRNVTFEEVFAHNFEYLEHDYMDDEHDNNDHNVENEEKQTNVVEKDNTDSPHVNFVTHNCLNCGYKVTVATHEDDSYQEDHDYCVKCSPLDLSVESLERKRLARHNESSSSD